MRYLRSKFRQYAILLLFVCCLSMMCVGVYSQRLRLSTYEMLWEMREPSIYYMRVFEKRPDVGRRWDVFVQQGKPVTTTVIFESRKGRKGFLDANNLTIEEVFNLAQTSCVDRGFADCGITFDSRYAYPAEVISYQLFIIEIEEFTSCGQDFSDCIKP